MRHFRQEGFTYLWALMVVALMGLGLSMAAEVAATSAQREKERELLAIGRQFRAALRGYHETVLAGGRHEYPASLDDLLKDNRAPGVVRHLRKVFVDPMTGKAEWGLMRVGGRIVGVHSLAKGEPIKQAAFEPQDALFAGKQAYSEWVFTWPSDLLLRPDASGNTPQGTVPPMSDVEATTTEDEKP